MDKYTDCKSCNEYISAKDTPLIFKFLECNKNHNKEFNEDLIKRFACAYEFRYKDFNKFIMLLKRMFILMNMWILGKDLMKYYYLIKKIFIVA